MRSSRTAFTLIELLVILAIVGILMVVVTVAASSMRRKSKQARCAANLRSVGQAFSVYSSRYGGYWPPAAYFYSPPGDPLDDSLYRRWFDFLSTEIGSPLNVDGTSSDQLFDDAFSRSIFRGCNELDQSSGVVAYGMNPNPRGVTPGARQPDELYAMSLSTKPRDRPFYKASLWAPAAARALAADGTTHYLVASTTNWEFDSSLDQPNERFFNLDFVRHRANRSSSLNEKSINMLFADGHVASVNGKEASKAVIGRKQ